MLSQRTTRSAPKRGRFQRSVFTALSLSFLLLLLLGIYNLKRCKAFVKEFLRNNLTKKSKAGRLFYANPARM